MTYRDMTFCPFNEDCKQSPDNGGSCQRALTNEVMTAARKWWNGDNPPITMFVNRPDCHESMNPWSVVEEEQCVIYE